MMPSQHVIEVWDPIPKEWGHSDLEAEKRIAYSAQHNVREMRQYAVIQLAEALSSADDVKRNLAKSEAERCRLEQRLEAQSNGDIVVPRAIEQFLDKSETEHLKLEREFVDLQNVVQ